MIPLHAFEQKHLIWDAYGLRLIWSLGYRFKNDYNQALWNQDEFIDLDEFPRLPERIHGLIVAVGRESRWVSSWDFFY